MRRAHGYCVCAASRQEGRQVCSHDHERACRMRRRADGVCAAACVVALQQHAAGGALLGQVQSSHCRRVGIEDAEPEPNSERLLNDERLQVHVSAR